MSFTFKKPLIKQPSISDNDLKPRPGLSTKRVSFDNATIMSDSDEENSIGRQNRRPVKKKDDDLLNMFRNELSDSDDDVVTKGRDKPSPKARHKSGATSKQDKDDELLQTKPSHLLTDELEQTINMKRKPRPPPRKRTVDSQSEDLDSESHDTSKPKVSPRHKTLSKERPLSATQTIKSEAESTRQNQGQLKQTKIDDKDSDDEVIVTSNRKYTDRGSTKTKEFQTEKHGFSKFKAGDFEENEDNKKESNGIFSTFSKQRKEKQGSLEEDEVISKETTRDNQFNLSKTNSMKSSSKSREEYDDYARTDSGPAIRKTLANDDIMNSKREQRGKVTSKLSEYDDDAFNSTGKRKQKQNSHDDDDGFNMTHKQKGPATTKLLDDDDDDDGFNVTRKQKLGSATTKLLDDDDDGFNVTQKQKDKSRATSKLLLDDDTRKQKLGSASAKLLEDKEEKDAFDIKRTHSGKMPSPHPRKTLQDYSKRTKSKEEFKDDSDLESGEESKGKVMKQVPVPRTRKDLHSEIQKEKPSKPMLRKSKLHFLDNDDDDDDSDDDSDDDAFNKSLEVKSHQKASRKDDVDGRTKTGKTPGWSSLDESDDDDEAVGKKVSLGGAKIQQNYEKQEVKSPAKPRPSPRPRQTIGSKPDRREQDDTFTGKNSKPYKYDFNQNLTSERDYMETPSYRPRVPTSERGETPSHRARTVPTSERDYMETPSYRPRVPTSERGETPSHRPRVPTSERDKTPSYRPRVPTSERGETPSYRPRVPTSERGETPSHRPRVPTSEREETPSYRPRVPTSERDYMETPSYRPRVPTSERDYMETPSHRPRVPQRPSSSQTNKRHNDWSSDEEDITHTFEDHIPDSSDVIDRMEDDSQWRNKREHRRPQSAVTPKKGPMKADRGIEEMTRSPQLRQTARAYDDDWGLRSQHSLGRQKASSLTNLNQTGNSEFRNYDSDDDYDRRNSLDTETIRQTVYDNWLSRKNVTIKKELSKKALNRQKEEKKAKEEKERQQNAQLAFKSWNEHKKGALKEQQSNLKAKKKHDKDKELEKKLKARDAVKYFDLWKSKKDEVIKETQKEKKKETNMKKKKEEEEKLDKATSSTKCFENWKSKKDEKLKQQFKEKKKKEKLEDCNKQEVEYEKTIQNADEFQKWVEGKGKPRKGPPPPALSQRAWVPGSRHTGDCIPAKVQPVVLPPSSNRARTLSGTYQLGRTKYYDY